jgi:hypothetical protein
MLINDVGSGFWEEINDGIAGSNYGWPNTEGPVAPGSPYRGPIYAYQHNAGDPTGCAIVGAAFYNPAVQMFPGSYLGKYFFADLCGGWIRTLDLASGTSLPFASGIPLPVDLAVAADGALYYLSRGNNSLVRVTFSGGGGAPCTGPSLAANPPGPTLGLNLQTTFTGAATCGGVANFMWWIGAVGGGGAVNWMQMTQYTPASTFNWTPTSPGTYHVGFWVKNQGTTPANGSFDAAIAFQYTVAALPPCSNPTLMANPPHQQVIVNTTVQVTAGATCGGVPSFKWVIAHVVGNEATYTTIDYSTNPQFAWTPTVTGSYYIYVFIQNQGGPPLGYDASHFLFFVVVPPPTPCNNPTLMGNPPPPNAFAGNVVQLTGGANCGGTPNFMWWEGRVQGQAVNWVQLTAYSTASFFNWMPQTPGTYYIGFWAKNQATTPANGSFDTSAVLMYTVNAATPCGSPSLNSNPPGPAVANNQPVMLTANVVCSGVPNYLWWVGVVNGPNVTWMQQGTWTTGNTFNWTATPPGSYYVGYWAKNQGTTPANGSFDTSAARQYTVSP